MRHLLAILALPVNVLIVVPALILASAPPDAETLGPAWSGTDLATWLRTAAGGVLLAAGLALVVATVRHFARSGHGTLAPWDPPRRLVVAGVYRHVRNPMISGVLATLLGEASLLRSPRLLAWWAVFLALNAAYLPLVEEPGLARRFGEDYRRYRRNVPRWIPRRTPWEPGPGAGTPSRGADPE